TKRGELGFRQDRSESKVTGLRHGWQPPNVRPTYARRAYASRPLATFRAQPLSTRDLRHKWFGGGTMYMVTVLPPPEPSGVAFGVDPDALRLRSGSPCCSIVDRCSRVRVGCPP